jgi:ribosomal protein L16 Arg81 hydroxylase
MSNTSRIDVFAENGRHNDYPRFEEEVVPHAISTVLGPGDMLFFPPGWWHAMRSEEVSISLSMWF